MQDSMIMDCAKKVENSCDWFLKEHPEGSDKAKCAKGIALVAKTFRELMIVVEQSKGVGASEAAIYESNQVPCGNHFHETVITFNSKGEFYQREAMILPNKKLKVMDMDGEKITTSDLLRMGVSPQELVEGFRHVTHNLSVREIATMPTARA